MTYQDFKSAVLDKRIGDGQCVSLVVNNSQAYVEHLFPGVPWTSIIAPVYSSLQMAGKSSQRLQWVANNHNDPNQVPEQGDIMVFGATPAAGYTNTFNNPDGHTGICDHADANGYDLLQQNAPTFAAAANVTHYPWKFRPCLGWYHPVSNTPSPAPVAAPKVQHVTLPPQAGPWHLYYIGSSYNPNDRAAVKGILRPDKFPGNTPPGITYPIEAWIGDNAVVVTTHDFGRGVVWVKGTSAKVS